MYSLDEFVFVATLRFFGAPKWKLGRACFWFLYCCANMCVLICLLRINSVQSVTNNPTQLYGRGFPNMFYINWFCHIFWCSQMEAEPCNFLIFEIVVQKTIQVCEIAVALHSRSGSFKLHGLASIWEHQKNVKLWQHQFYIKYIGKSSSRKLRWVIYCTAYRMAPQKTY